MICKDKYESERFVLSHRTDAALMGGYLRDLILERPWKDIDLFLCVHPEALKAYTRGAAFTMYWWSKHGEQLANIWHPEAASPEYAGANTFCVMECKTLPGVQLILYSTGYDSAGTSTQYEKALGLMQFHFPCSLSKVTMNLEVEPARRWINVTSSFEWSVKDQALEFSVSCSQEYRDRMFSYFPHFSVKPDNPYF